LRDLAPLIKHVGRGARLAKDLDRGQAAFVMDAIAAGRATPAQTGGFLLAMRMKSESAEELAGFVDGLRPHAPLALPVDDHTVDVDLHGDGREGRPSVSLAAACVAAACGARVLLRGAFGGRFARNDLLAVFTRLGIDPAAVERAPRALGEAGVAVVDLAAYAPRVAALLALREELGVRTCVNSAVKLLDPAGARRAAIGIFHGPYHEPVGHAARLLGVRRAAIVQAPGGVPEPSSDKPTRVSLLDAGTLAAPQPLPPAGGTPADIIETAEDLADLLERILRSPRDAPAGALAMTLAAAALQLWTAGLAQSPTDVTAAAAALEAGAAARVLDVVRSCYSS